MIVLEPGEKIIKKVRKHWFVVFSEVFVMTLLLFVPILAWIFLDSSEIFVIRGSEIYLFLTVESMWALFVWLMFCKFWVDYYLDVWVITDKRIIDIEQKGFFHREVGTIKFEKIEDIVVVVRGIIPTMLKFGEIRVQSAAESREFVMRQIANPYGVKDIIYKLIGKSSVPAS